MSGILRNNPVSHFSLGFLYPFRAARYISRHPSLWKFVLIPFLINTVVFSVSVYFGLNFFSDTVVALIPTGEAWYWLILYYLSWVVAAVVTAVLVFFSFTVVGNLIASPFNDLLSERTEEKLRGGISETPFSLRGFMRDARYTLVEEFKKISAFVLAMVFVFAFNLLPGFGTLIYSVLSILITLFFLSVEYTGYIFSRRRVPFREQRRYLLGRKFLMLGFSTGLLVILAIPLVQFLCIPMGVVGATLLWVDHRNPELEKGAGA